MLARRLVRPGGSARGESDCNREAFRTDPLPARPETELSQGSRELISMDNQRLGMLRILTLLFLLPGLAGVILSAWVSTTYLENLPRMPMPVEQRMTPRNIHGVVVYQSTAEDRRLELLQDGSVGVFVVGLGLGLVYMRKWGLAQALTGSEDEEELVADRN